MEGFLNANIEDDDDFEEIIENGVVVRKKKKVSDSHLFPKVESKPREKSLLEKLVDVSNVITGSETKVENKSRINESIYEDTLETVIESEVELSPEFDDQIVREIIEIRSSENLEDITFHQDNLQLSIKSSIDSFHSKFLEGNIDLDQAFIITLSEISETQEQEPIRSSFHERIWELNRSKEPDEFDEEEVQIHATKNSVSNERSPKGVIKKTKTKVDNFYKSQEKPMTMSESVVNFLNKPIKINPFIDSDVSQPKSKAEQRIRELNQSVVVKESAIREAVIVKSKKASILKLRSENIATEYRVKPEKIGKVVLQPVNETFPEIIKEISKSTHKEIEDITRSELLDIAEIIYIDGYSLRSAYDKGLVGDKDLKRIVAEYQRGGNNKSALRSEIMGDKIDIERDPEQRDKSLRISKSGSTSISKLVQKVIKESDDEINKNNIFTGSSIIIKSKKSQTRKINLGLADAVMGLTIAMLLMMVIILYLNRN